MSLTADEKRELARRGLHSPQWFLRFFLQDWFPTPLPWFHYGVMAIVLRRTDFLLQFNPEENYGPRELDKIFRHFVWQDSEEKTHPIFVPVRDDSGEIVSIDMVLGRYTMIMIPRGFSKTTLLNGLIILQTVYQLRQFPFYVSKTGSHAEKQISSVATQLSTNQRLLAVFGAFRPPQRNDESLRWSESEGLIQTLNGVTLAAKGIDGQVRGTNINARRPDILIIDDLEDKENTKTEDRRKTTRGSFFSDLLPCLPEMDKESTAVFLCNLVVRDSLGVHLLGDPEWTSIRLGAVDLDGEPLWEQLLSLDELERKKRSYSIQGELATYYLEYHNEIRVVEDQKFRPEFFIISPKPPAPSAPKAIMMDPAMSEDRRADFCTYAVMERHGKLLHLRDYVQIRSSDEGKKVEIYFDLIKKHGLTAADRFGIETIAYQKSLVYTMREEMFRRNVFFEITKIGSHKEAKVPRVEGILQPRYSNGFITHQLPFPELMVQFYDWPNGKKDGPDVLAMCVALLDPSAPMAATADLAADQYEDLDAVFDGKDWRIGV
jgi:hypothetical protein